MNLYLIDGNSYIYRAFYAIKGLTNSKGFPTNAIYGFTNMLFKIIKERKPDGIVVSFDLPVPTERHRIFDDYKAHRKETPEDLVRQLPYIRQIVEAFRINIVEMPGYEADDILSTLARKAERDGANAYIVTGDKDMLQIVSSRIKIYDPVRDKVLDEKYVREKFGVGPERVTECMALTGDASDNIPGIKGIGEKIARELLLMVENIEDLFAHPEMIRSERVRTLITENAGIARLSMRLATIDVNVPVDAAIKDFSVKEPDWQRLLSLFSEFEFTSLLKLIPSAKHKIEYEIIYSISRLKEVLKDIHDEFAFDIFPAEKKVQKGLISGMAISNKKESAFYIPVGYFYPEASVQTDKNEALELLAELFENPAVSKINHNLKHSIALLMNEGMVVRGTLYDTMLASYLLNPNKQNHTLEDVVFEYFSYRKKSLQEVLGKKVLLSDVPVDSAACYAAENSVLMFKLKGILFEKVREESMSKVYKEIEMPLINVLVDMERAGFKIDSNKLADMSKELCIELDAIRRRIYFIAGEEFNINSPKQLNRILFHTLGLKPGKKTKTGFSTQVSVLEDLSDSHPLPLEIMDYRSLSKLKSTYIDALPLLVNPQTNRIHTSFNQTVVSTGRLSSSNPNLQNIPVRGEWGRRIRSAFISEGRNLLLSADYSNIELRILAALSSDAGLTDAFMHNVDIHSRTAAEIFGTDNNAVTQEMRRVAKAVNFGVIYGISPFGLSETLNISREQAKRYIDNYFERHSGVRLYIEKTLRDAGQNGYVLTMFGRKRAVPELRSSNPNTRALGERLAVNSPIQGTAADIMKIAMINICRNLTVEGLRAKMILQVHDELVFEAPAEESAQTGRLVKETMEGAMLLSVPLNVKIGQGRTWSEAHE